MSYRTSSFASLRGALLVTTASAVVVGWSGVAHAQATGQVAVESGAGATRGQETLQRLILAPPEPELTLFATPRYSVDRYDSYTEPATFFDPASGDVTFGTQPGAFQVPEFDISSAGVSVGADYLFANGFFVGGSLNYNHVDFDFDELSPAARQQQLFGLSQTNPFFLQAGGLGDPVDREFDEYGGTVALGYFRGPVSLIISGNYSYRDLELRRREYNTAFEFVETTAEFNSDRYSVELGASYRIFTEAGSVQPFVSVSYSREEVDGFNEDFAAGFQDPIGVGDFMRVPQTDLDVGSTERSFNAQTIESIPLTVGLLVVVPFGAAADEGSRRILDFTGVTVGLSGTHDFEDQERTVISRSENFPNFSTRVEEENRNRDYITLLGSVDFALFGQAFATFTYEHDQAFDERDTGDTVRLQLRVPL